MTFISVLLFILAPIYLFYQKRHTVKQQMQKDVSYIILPYGSLMLYSFIYCVIGLNSTITILQLIGSVAYSFFLCLILGLPILVLILVMLSLRKCADLYEK